MINSALAYRREIDGLRTVAVLPVILFHAGFSIFSGGYVGVDVFFVISGFLITTIIVKERSDDRFSILRFYERRARRILPALFVVIAVCLPLAIITMLPSQLRDFGRSIVAVSLFVSNVLFWREGGYFSAASEEKPLLHTWSLAVEEQYYLFVPLVIMALWRLGRLRLGIALALAAAVSLGLAEWGWRNQPTANFFLLPTRAWELLSGSLLALWLGRRAQPSGLAAQAGGLVGLAMIAGPIFLFSGGTPFPSLWTVLPVAGTVLIILCASPSTWVGRLLGWKPLVGIGLVSYSAYLWHQPLFAFARIRSLDEPPQWLMAGLAVLALLLAWGTWRFVERPFRDQALVSRRRIFTAALVGSLALIGAGAFFDLTGGLPGRIAPEHRAWAAATSSELKGYVEGRYRREVEDRPLPGDRPGLAIVGDSFSQDVYNMIREAGAFDDYAISGIYIPTVCQPYRGSEDIRRFREARTQALCDRTALEGARLRTIRSAEVVIFAFRWQPWSVDRMGQTVAALGLRPDQTVIAFGIKGFESEPRRFLPLRGSALAESRTVPNPDYLETDRRLRAALPPGARFIDIHNIACDHGRGCPNFTPEGALISLDGAHLTKDGARYLGGLLFAEPELSPYRRRDESSSKSVK